MSLATWALILLIQNAAFTWVSRARNGGSYGYHAVAAVCANGLFFGAQFVLVSVVAQGVTGAEALGLGLIYVAATTTGSVLMHIASVRWLERGKRRVGAA
jgi:hypothetical protein